MSNLMTNHTNLRFDNAGRIIRSLCAVTALTGLGAFMSGCASREPLPELVAARQAVDVAARDPDVATAGAVRLQEARKALNAAEEASRERAKETVIREYSFSASRNAQIASEQAAEARARKAVQQGEAERNRVLLESRTQEAENARAAAATNAQAATANAQTAAANAQDAAAAREEAERLKREMEGLEAKQTERGMVLTLGDVLFDTNRAEVKPGARANLERVGRFLADNANVRIIIEGHTDNRGTDEYNRELSRRRAEAVRDVLLAGGGPGERIRVEGLGEAYPVASNDNAAGQQQNRRVEIVFSDQGGTFAPGGERR